MGSNRRALLAVAVVALCLGVSAGAASGHATVLEFQQVARGFAAPTYVTSAPGDPTTLYVVEQAGRIRIVRDGRIAGTFLDIRSRVRSGGEQGLLSVAFHPGYQKNRLFYVNYTDTNGDTRVVQFRSSGKRGLPGSAKVVLFVKQPYANHNGGQVAFDRQGYLYVGMGDGGSGGDPENRAQSFQSRLGKLLRRNPLRAGSAWQVMGYGLRNPWRFSFDRQTGDLWIADVGQNHIEEIDFRPRARIGKLANYGWPRYEGRAVYDAGRPWSSRGQTVFPVAQYTHAEGGCSVTGGYVYRGSESPAARGRYFYGDYCSGMIWSVARGSAPSVLPTRIANLSSFGEDGNGELYATSSDGALYRLTG